MDRKWWTLIAVCVATFMLLLDVTVVNVALPSIRASLGSSFSDLQWVIDAYALTLAALLLVAGSFADLFGRRIVFSIGLVVFVAASVGCGLAGTPTALNLARAVQGIGGAMMFATSLALLAAAFPGGERATAFGLWGATTGAAVAIGPLIGGALTDSLGWEWIFFVNVPIGAAALAVALLRVSESRPPRTAGVDWLGTVVFSGALFSLIFGLIRGNAEGWSSPLIVTVLAGAAALLALFVLIEARVAAPMLDLSLFRNPSFVGASVAAFVLSASMFSMFLYLTLYVQNVLGYQPLETGLRFLPTTLLSFFVAPLAGRLSDRLPVRAFLGGGLALVGVGLLLLSGIDTRDDWTTLLPGFICTGIGVGLINPPLASAAVGVVHPSRSGMASGINSTFRQVGIATGIAALGAVFQARVTSRIGDAVAGTPVAGQAKQLGEAVASSGAGPVVAAVPPPARQAVAAAARQAFIGGLNEILVIAAVVAFVGAVLSFALVRERDFIKAGDQPPLGRPEPEPEPAAALA